ncbi:MAG TPA: hypothetical protein VL282_05325, partial [Tepidisphaeraceae bacterium]|nr:hypothetical protein [Tepidisphaeraceae bacterium]
MKQRQRHRRIVGARQDVLRRESIAAMVISSVRIFQEGTVIESLETRRLMSVSFAKASGTATVTGTDKPDLIEFGS